MTWRRRVAYVSCASLLAAAAFTWFLRHSDGPVLFFLGGPLRSGELAEFEKVNWDSLDGHRELEMEVVPTRRSRLIWFTVHEGRPYISCGLACDSTRVERWPYYVDQDGRVVLRIDGARILARMERVAPDSPEYAAVREAQSRKFSGAGGVRDAAEVGAHDAIMGIGRSVSAEATTGRRLYRVVAPAR
jgi:hypothetical protein